MRVEVLVTESPLRLEPLMAAVAGCGAVARFDGVVRGTEEGRPIAGIDYEAYAPMAERVMRELLERLGREHPFELARAHHRIGFVPAGEAAISLDVHSAHRAEAFAVLSRFMDLLKREVPVWKRGTR